MALSSSPRWQVQGHRGEPPDVRLRPVPRARGHLPLVRSGAAVLLQEVRQAGPAAEPARRWPAVPADAPRCLQQCRPPEAVAVAICDNRNASHFRSGPWRETRRSSHQQGAPGCHTTPGGRHRPRCRHTGAAAVRLLRPPVRLLHTPHITRRDAPPPVECLSSVIARRSPNSGGMWHDDST